MAADALISAFSILDMLLPVAFASKVLLVNVVVLSALIGLTPPIVAFEPNCILSKPSITPAETCSSSNNNLALPLATSTAAPEPCLTVIICPLMLRFQ